MGKILDKAIVRLGMRLARRRSPQDELSHIHNVLQKAPFLTSIS